MASSNALTALADLTEEQWGLFTRRQAEATGMAWSTLARLSRDTALFERIAHGVYRLRGAPPADHLDLRAAWLQLAPDVPAWQRTPETGVVSHRSAADLCRLGHLPADMHEFTFPIRRQSRRPDLRLHRSHLLDTEWTTRHGLPVTRPARTAADLLADGEDPGAVGHVIADALREEYDRPATVAHALSPYAARFGLRRGDGVALLRWLLDLTNAAERHQWLKDAISQEIHQASPCASPTASNPFSTRSITDGWSVEREQLPVAVERRAARAILIDAEGRLALIKRTKPEQPPYWTTPGGGVEESDASVEAALHRELAEELGATAVRASQVFLFSSPSDAGVAVQHFFVARLSTLDESTRDGAEFSDPSRGGYTLDRVAMRGEELASIDLKPAALKDFILTNREALLAEASTP